MWAYRALATATLLVVVPPLRATDGADMFAFDGRWTVQLVCVDTQDRKGVVKGYDYRFEATIVGGKLDGRYGADQAPASVHYTGEVAADGTLEVKATGTTGDSEYSVGQVARGTGYGYTLAGHLDHDRGQAVRRETRPCTARFTRLR